ncbi:MAG: hypothetical protein O7D97_01485 [Planctomycetota bacterium]|nr:hypothetical protein [Planctomycetota bacterium]
MTRKRSSPALYELIHARSARAAAAPQQQVEESSPAPAAGQSLGWLSPGRTVRLPVGYLLLGSAAGIVLLIIVYMVGYARAERVVKAELQPVLVMRDQEALPEGRPQDPMVKRFEGWTPPARPAEATKALETFPDDADRPAAWPDRWGPILSDPRRPEHNYFVLIHTRRDSALRLARFCRDQGLEAYVVQAKNVSLYRVIALPGYTRGRRDSEEVRALERRIVEAARKWKLQVNPRDDLAYYPERFEG